MRSSGIVVFVGAKSHLCNRKAHSNALATASHFVPHA
uniref:Uncharacterized protein n=1 Tax=Anguilla anguilla TaxID=7936 RepID=A0A0E9QA08_ANGAN